MNLNVITLSLKNAERGHRVLKSKSTALKMEFSKVSTHVVRLSENFRPLISDLYYLLAQARYFTGDFKNMIMTAQGKARITVDVDVENVSGVSIYKFTLNDDKKVKEPFSRLGLSKGGQSFQKTKQHATKVVSTLIELATQRNRFLSIEKALLKTNRKVNALEHMLIPKYKRTLAFIKDELDEAAREDFFRLKMVQKKKRKQKVVSEDSSSPSPAFEEVNDNDILF